MKTPGIHGFSHKNETARKALRGFRRFLYNKNHKTEARKALKNIESQKGPTNPKLIKMSNEYAIDVLGSHSFSPWLYVYSAVSEKFKEGWLPDNYYGGVLVPALNGEYGKISSLKPLNKRILNSNILLDTAYHINGLFFDDKLKSVPFESMKSRIYDSNRVAVFKADRSSRGDGIFILHRHEFVEDTIKTIGNGVIQKFISQADELKRFSPEAVSCLRMTTAVDNSGTASLRSCYLRVGRAGDSHLRSQTNIRIAICKETGAFSHIGFLPNWLSVERHPDTNELFRENTYPNFSKCIDVVLDLHENIPMVRCVGWDIVVDSNGSVVLIEWNGEHNDIKFSEAVQGPCFLNLGWEDIL